MREKYIKPTVRVSEFTYLVSLLSGSPDSDYIPVGGSGTPDAKENIFNFDNDAFAGEDGCDFVKE